LAVAPALPIESTARFADHTRRQVAVRLLPFVFILYVTNYLDRTSVAYAGLGMSRDLGFNDRVFGLGAGVFFISYVALQIPGALLVERWSARRMISATMIAWGFLTSLTALVHTPAQLYLARFALGAAEAGFFPGVVVYLSHWFIRQDRCKSTSNFMAAIPLSFIIGSPLAGWILGHGWFHIQGWRWLFVLEGLPAIVLGVAAFFFLTDWPHQAHWLAPEQRDWIGQKLEEEKPPAAREVSSREALVSPMILVLAGLTFLQYFAGYAIFFWMPTMLKRQSGFSDARVGLIGAIPYIVLFLAMLFNGWHSDRSGERHWHSAVPLFISAIGLLALVARPQSMVLTMALFSMVAINTAYLPIFWAIPTEFLTASAAAAAVGAINAVGSIAGFAGPYAFGYLVSRTGSFAVGMAVLAVCSMAAGLLILWSPRRVAGTSKELCPD
jgi:ACS family tartrate transporter-like MFS transporter